MAGLNGGGAWGGYDDDDDWGLSAEQLDQIERDAIRQLAERKASASAASTSPAPASALPATSPLPSRANASVAAASSPLGGNHPAARASLEARFGKVEALSPSRNAVNNSHGSSPKVSVHLFLHSSGVIAARFPYNQLLVGAFHKIPKASWNAKERVWMFPPPSLSIAEEVLHSVPGLAVEVHKLDPLVQRALTAALGNKDLQGLYDRISPDLESKLMPFQREGIRFVLQHGGRALIADEMGLGKTLQALAFASCLHDAWPVLVISPSSLRLHWASMIHKWLDIPMEDILVVLPQTGGSHKAGFRLVYSNTKGDFRLDGLFNVISYDVVPKIQSTLLDLDFKWSAENRDSPPNQHRVGGQAGDAAGADVKAGGERALDIPRDALEHRKMRLPRVVHEETHLPNGIGEVGRVGVRYRRAPARLRYAVASATGAPSVADSLARIVIADESHFMKNGQAKRTIASLPVLQKAQYVVLLSGTPALSRPIELFTQLQALYPTVYKNVSEYGNRYCKGGFFGLYQGASNHEELHNLMKATVMIRRLKKDVLSQLPVKLRQQVFLDLSEKDLKHVRPLLRELETLKINVESADSKEMVDSLKFAQKNLITKIYNDSAIAKIPAVLDFLGTIIEANCKFLIFAHHQPMLDAIEQYLLKKKVKCIRIDGQTPVTTRQTLVTDFQNKDDIRAAVLSIRAAGYGLTLTAASTVLFAELSWTPGEITQAEDRAHRIGQDSSVNVSYLLAHETVDDLMWGNVQGKLENLGQMLDGQEKTLEVSQIDNRPSPSKQQKTLDGFLKRGSTSTEGQPSTKYPRF
ncbi:hypothetical protein U9M48_015988 [Paspalum notatum var. saurae]|uniref:SWI/SNF-related matrix-associated actin-dependent regulator of chromatin subfamily A-like protein 1 n=1 Tax=Paspalum notatum var. saurae TaxID=547442 RepID=A0AAQ3T467_PASNO